MKDLKYIGLLTLAWLFVLPATAQLGEQRRYLAIGFNAGVNLNTVSFQPKIKQKSMKAMAFGVTMRYMCEKYFKMMCGLQMELNYSQRGWEENIEDGSENTYKRTLNYLEVPFMAHLAFGKDAMKRGVKFFINAGPQVSLFMSDKEEMSDAWDTSNRTNNVVEQYGKEVENKLDYGITGGAGLELSTGIGHFLLEGRYYYGFGDFFKSSKKDDFERSGHSTISIRFTYLFDLFNK